MSDAAKTLMADHIEHFWNAISEPHVRILIDMRRDHEDGSFHWDSSSFGDDVAKALVGSRASAPKTHTALFGQADYAAVESLAECMPKNKTRGALERLLASSDYGTVPTPSTASTVEPVAVRVLSVLRAARNELMMLGDPGSRAELVVDQIDAIIKEMPDAE